MKKQSNNGGKPPTMPKKVPKERVIGANAVHLSEDEANTLVGGIIEKGISENNFSTAPSTAPLPSVLPFPVARHRSHGPHWTPNVSHSAAIGAVVDEYDEFDEEDNDPTNYAPIADYAEPIRRKKKKEIDTSRWREFVSTIDDKDKNQRVQKGVEKQKIDGDSKVLSDEKYMVTRPSFVVNDHNSLSSLQGTPEVAVGTTTAVRSVDMELDRLNKSSAEERHDNAVILGHNQSSSNNRKGNNVQDDVGIGMENISSLDMLSLRDKQSSVTLGSSNIGNEQGYMSLESQIDVENRAFLEKMSPEEIAEAQAEIKNRINPELLKTLKKRGIQKLEKTSSGCNSDAGNIPALKAMQATKHLNEGEKKASISESGVSHPVIASDEMNIEKKADKSVQSMLSKGSSLWDIWSKRVEAARTVRFSFDGNVTEGSSLDLTYTSNNVAERDFLRTEGDPGAVGYTIKEALALTRSVVPGQRAFALHLLASVISKALHSICESRLDFSASVNDEKSHGDWEAIWAYLLGPEPELALSLRLALDDNHNSVVLASVKAIQCVLACDMNENFFNRIEKMTLKDQYTAPVFRTRPDIRHGYLGGSFWKYSTKPSNILLLDEHIVNDKNEGEHTIEDDNNVAGQDVAAGLVRMGILPRLQYLLETGPSMALEECILSILVAVARHSPTCANAIWKSERLIQTIVSKFTMNDAPELRACRVKSVTLLRVLAQSCKTTCIEFIQKGFFQTMTWQLYRVTYSIDEWISAGKENCKRASELMVEQLRFWKVCVMHGRCISSFTGFFPALCLWLNPPTLDKLIEVNVFHEFATISAEVYLVLGTLAKRLPELHSTEEKNREFQEHRDDNFETWCWSDVGPMVDMALKWLDMMVDSTFSGILYQQNGINDKFVNHTHVSSLLWLLSAVMHLLKTVLMKATPGDLFELKGNRIGAKLPDFVAKLSHLIIKNGVLNISDENKDSTEQCALGSFVEKLCHLRHQSDSEVSIASACCLRELLQVIVSADHLVQLSGDTTRHKFAHGDELVTGSKMLHGDIFNGSLSKWRKVLSEFAKLVGSEWQFVQQIEVFGRGGPAPGVGVGWGGSVGGFWSLNIALIQADARLLMELLRTFQSLPSRDLPEVEEHTYMLHNVNSALALTLVAGPGDEVIIHNVLDILLTSPVLKYLDQCILHLLHSHNKLEPFKFNYEESDFIQFGKILASHFRNRWLSVKKKKKPETKEGNIRGTKMVKPSGNSLDTIPEDMETTVMVGDNGNTSMVEWARQALPLPSHWLLSPLVSIGDIQSSKTPNTSGEMSLVKDPMGFQEVAEAGLFFLLGIEAMSSKLSDKDNSPVLSIPLIWKLHALSVPFLVGMEILEEEKSRYMYGALQSLYGQHLDDLWFSSFKNVSPKTENPSDAKLFRDSCLRFQSEIHENYSTFIETLVGQFAAISYGDVIYGRQIAMYLHRQVETSVRLPTWNALSNAHALELLPPLANCLSQAEGFLEPIEEDEGILEAYVKSWVSGSLDRAAIRDSMTYAIAVHHLSSFIFNTPCGEKKLLRNKLVKSLLRDYSRKQQHEAMMLDLLHYHHSGAIQKPEQNTSTSLQMDDTYPRLELLKDSCEGNSQLLTIVENLKSSISKKQTRF
ncbi:Transcriptional elongation regulator MINIYO [Bienertia sinuspersici]